MATSKKGLCKPKPTYTTASCGLCPKLDTDDMVACDKCDTWFHFECVGVTQEIENEEWLCKQCRKEAVKLADKVSSRGLKKSLPPSTAWSTTTMSSRQKRIALLKLEEEQALRLEFINRKYEILACDDDSSDEELLHGNTYNVDSLSNSVLSNRRKLCVQSNSDDERELCNQMNFDDSHRVSLYVVRNSYEEKRNSVVQSNLKFAHDENETVMTQPATVGQNQSVHKPPTDRKVVSQPSCFNQMQRIHTNRMKGPETNLRQMNSAIGQSKSVQLPPMGQPDDKYEMKNAMDRYMLSLATCDTSNIAGQEQQQPHVKSFQQSFQQPSQSNTLGDSRQVPPNAATTTRKNASGYEGYVGTLTPGHIAARHVFSKDLPQYWGKPESWPMFLSALITSTNECGFSDAENLGRLQRCLKGNALELVESHLLHASSVPGAVETLHTIFGRPSIIIYNLLEKIEKTSAPKADDLNSLIKFGILVKNLSATIQSSGDLGQLRNPYLIQSITNKLPTQIALNWGSFIHGKDVDLAVMGDWLYNLAEIATGVINPLSLKISDKRDQELDSHRDDSSPSTYVNAHSDDSDCDKFKCRACNTYTRHALENCKNFKEYSVEQRWDFIKQYRLCGSCFGSHKLHKCYRKRKCGAGGCTREHHILLHNTIESSSPKAIVPADNRSVVAYDEESVKQMGSVNGGKDVVEQR